MTQHWHLIHMCTGIHAWPLLLHEVTTPHRPDFQCVRHRCFRRTIPVAPIIAIRKVIP